MSPTVDFHNYNRERSDDVREREREKDELQPVNLFIRTGNTTGHS
jgi:hypothetical protein